MSTEKILLVIKSLFNIDKDEDDSLERLIFFVNEGK